MLTEEAKLDMVKTIVEYSINQFPVVELMEVAAQLMMAELWAKEDDAIMDAYSALVREEECGLH